MLGIRGECSQSAGQGSFKVRGHCSRWAGRMSGCAGDAQDARGMLTIRGRFFRGRGSGSAAPILRSSPAKAGFKGTSLDINFQFDMLSLQEPQSKCVDLAIENGSC